MQHSPDDPFQTRNHILSALPDEELDRLRTGLQPVELYRGKLLWASYEPIEHVWFPEAGIASMIAPLESGEGLEVGMIGREGVIGLPVAFGVDETPCRAEIQVPGHGLRMETSAFRREMERSPVLRGLLLRYAQAFFNQISQTAACNGRHPINERLARWLLMSHDRTDEDELPLTQEYLSIMLGVRRPGVTVAAGTLVKAGLIRNQNGRITILNRNGLELVSCECYGLVRDYSEQLFGRA